MKSGKMNTFKKYLGAVALMIFILGASQFAMTERAFAGQLSYGEKIYATGGDVIVTVGDSDAGYFHQLWLYSPSTIFVSDSTNGIGYFVNLGNFTAGTELVFGIDVTDYLGAHHIFETGPGTNNLDGAVHAAVHLVSPGVVSVGFEDLIASEADWDYNDCVFTITGTTSVPEPTTMLLFGTGLVGLAGFIRRKKV